MHYAEGLEHEVRLLEGRLSIMTDEVEMVAFELDVLDDAIDIISGRKKAKDDDIVEEMGCFHLTTCKSALNRIH